MVTPRVRRPLRTLKRSCSDGGIPVIICRLLEQRGGSMWATSGAPRGDENPEGSQVFWLLLINILHSDSSGFLGDT